MSNRPRAKVSMKWSCASGHDHDSYEQAEACIKAHAAAHQVDPYAAPLDAETTDLPAGVIFSRPFIPAGGERGPEVSVPVHQLACGCYATGAAAPGTITICGAHGGPKVRTVLADVGLIPNAVTEIPFRAMALTFVHEAGPVHEDGSQRCTRCGKTMLDPFPSHDAARVDRDCWGFVPGRRVAEGPRGLYLLTADRQLAPGEVSCR